MNASDSRTDGKDWLDARILALVFMNGEEVAVRRIAQLIGRAPCPKCDYVKEHCRCVVKD